MLHCPQGIPRSLKVQLLIQEYPFKTMLYYTFCKEYYTSSNDNSMHCVFLQKHHPLSKGLLCIYIYMKGYPLVQELKSYHTQPYSFTSTAVCLEGNFLKGMLHTFERNIVYNCICIYIYTYLILSYSELCYLKMILYFPNE